jgi:L-lactate dehydrogenase complex protein LldG
MSGARDEILGAIRSSLRRGETAVAPIEEVDARLAAHPHGPIPARGDLPPGERVALFCQMAEEVSTTIARVASLAEVPAAVAGFLADNNLPAAVRLAPSPELEGLPWGETAPLLELASGAATPGDQASVTGAFAAVAETGSLMLLSGPEGPTTLNFLPDTHFVVLKASQVVGHYEEAWARLRAARGGAVLPRSVNFITGPSRSADIEQKIQLGAHGPRNLHVVLVEDLEED